MECATLPPVKLESTPNPLSPRDQLRSIQRANESIGKERTAVHCRRSVIQLSRNGLKSLRFARLLSEVHPTHMATETGYGIRKLRPIHARSPDLVSLRQTFGGKYGNLLGLLEIKVQPEALSALTQYYDPPLRCFTFRNFQLAPILEEYERILGMPLEKKSWNGLKSILQANLEGKLDQLHWQGDWGAFMDIFRLLIYDIVLFSYIEDHIDLAAIDAFLAKRDRGKNPMIVILAYTCYSMNYCYEINGKGLRCYTTIRTYVFKGRTTYPREDYHWSWVKTMSKVEWTKHLDDAIEKCGGFPNVPLLDTQGAINYNPELVPRQVGYAMALPPPEEAITPFIIHDLGAQDGGVSRIYDKLGGVLFERDLSGDLEVAAPHPVTRPGSKID
ncbi:hypothetical protein CR513_53778, partial [Mucuna pruriens]